MEAEAKYTLVGTAVLVLIGLLVGAIIWLKSTEGERDDGQCGQRSRQRNQPGTAVECTAHISDPSRSATCAGR